MNEAKIENRQVDKAMTGTGIVQNLKMEETVIVTGGTRARAVHLALREVAKQVGLASVEPQLRQ